MKSACSLLTAVAVIAGLAEVGMTAQFALDGKPDSAPAPAAVFAAAFLLMAWFLNAGKFWPVVVLLLLFAVEIAFIPMYGRESWVDWAEQAGFAAISVVGVIVAIATIANRKRTLA